MDRASYGIALRLEGYGDPRDAWTMAADPTAIGPRRGSAVRGHHPDP